MPSSSGRSGLRVWLEVIRRRKPHQRRDTRDLRAGRPASGRRGDATGRTPCSIRCGAAHRPSGL